MANRYSKALKHIKKDYSLTEAPTNSMSRVYSLNNPGHQLGPVPNNAKVFVPDIDGNWPAGIPGTPGEGGYTRPAGFWTGERDWDTVTQPNFSHEAAGANGTDTSGLIASNGAVLTALPPNSRSFILGPLVDGHTYLHGNDAYTNIGYIQKDTRQFVLLARVDGQWEAGGYPIPETAIQYGWPESRVWDGTANGFTAYNSNFTLEMAQWFRGEMLGKRFVKEVAYFYSGGVSQPPITGGPASGMYGGSGVGAGGDGSSAAGSGSGRGYGSGGEPNIGEPQVDNHGNVHDAGLFGINWNALKDMLRGKGLEVGAAIASGIEDGIDAAADLLNSTSKDVADKFAQIMSSKGGAIAGVVMAAASDIRGYIKTQTQGGESEVWARGGDHPSISNTTSETAYSANLAMSLTKSVGTGKMVMIDNSNLDPKIVASKMTKNDIDMMLKASGITNVSDLSTKLPSVDTSADSVLNPNKDGEVKKTYFGGQGFGGEGGSIMQPFIDPVTGEIRILNTGDKTVRIGGESGEKFDWNTQTFTDVPAAGGVIDKVKSAVESGQVASLVSKLVLDGEIDQAAVQETTEMLLNDPSYQAILATLDSPAGDYLKGGAKGFTNGGVAGAVLYGKLKTALGLRPKTDLEESGGHGHVRRQTNFSMNDMKPEVKEYLMEKLGYEEPEVEDNDGSGSGIDGFNTQASSQGTTVNWGGDKGSATIKSGNYNGLANWEKSILQNKLKVMSGAPLEKELKRLKKVYPGFKQIGKNEIISIKDGSIVNYLEQRNLSIENELLSEDKLRILKEIKKPVVLIEASPKMSKLKGYKPNFKGKFSPQNTPEVTACPESDKLAGRANARGQTWRTENKYWQGYETTERMNIIYDRMGHGQQAWDAIIEDARKKNGWKNREIQEQLNQIAHEKAMRKIDPDFESPWNLNEMEDPNKDEIDKYMNDPLVKRVRKKLLTQIDYKDKPSKKGYPEQPPVEIDPKTGMHPKYGKTYKYDKLDPVSAVSMRNAPTGNPEIDANVEKAAKKKYVKPNVKEEWASDWRDSISYD